MKIELLEIIEEELGNSTDRGEKGFGSSSKDFKGGMLDELNTNVRSHDAPFNFMS